MRILVLNWRDINHPEAGGAEVHLHQILKRVAHQHRVVLVSSRFAGCHRSEIVDGIEIVRIGSNSSFNFAALWQYLTRLRHEDFDVVVDDISKVPLFTPLYVKRPLVAIIHMRHKNIFFKELPLPMALYAYLLERLMPLVYRRSPLITGSGSSSLENELLAMGIPQDNINLVHTAIDHSLYRPNTSSVDESLTLYFGRIKPYKQVDRLVRAFGIVSQTLPQVKLMIAGKGDDAQLRSLVARLGLNDSVSFSGEVSEEEKVKILQRAWVLVTPSMREGWGLTVTEANACGTPCIAYDVPGLRDSIRDGETGLLVPHGDINALAEAIVKVLSDGKLRAKLSRNAIEWASNFSWDKTAEEFERVLQEVVDGR